MTARGYQHDPLLDDLPNADEYVEPPPPRRARQAHRNATRARQRADQRDERARDTDPGMPSVHFGEPDRPTVKWPAPSGQPRPPSRFGRSIHYTLIYRRDGETGSAADRVTELSILVLPHDVRKQLLKDMGLLQAIEELLRDLGVIPANQPMSEALREQLASYLRL